MNTIVLPPAVAAEANCYLTTVGRRTGQRHEIEIWFVHHGGALHLISGGGERADWVKNLEADPAASIRVTHQEFEVNARFSLTDSDERLRVAELFASKYSRHFGEPREWMDDAFFVRFERRAAGDL